MHTQTPSCKQIEKNQTTINNKVIYPRIQNSSIKIKQYEQKKNQSSKKKKKKTIIIINKKKK